MPFCMRGNKRLPIARMVVMQCKWQARNPQREDALRIYSAEAITLTEIAKRLGLPASRIRKWKFEDKWE